MKFENQVCPVCNNVFKEDEDIVVCPDCGTPHHRDCYKALGECKNKSLHSENFVFKKEEKAEKLDVIIEDDVKKTEDVVNIVNVEFNSEKDKNNEELKNSIEELFKNINGKPTSQVLINNIPSSYYEASIGKNQNYYMPRFLIMEKTQKNYLFNACAFIFPMAWTLYRKMYKLSLLVLAIYIAFMGVSMAPFLMNEDYTEAFYACAEEDYYFMEKVLLYETGNNVTLTKNQAEFIEASNAVTVPKVLVYGTMITSVLLRAFMGVSATKLYKKKLTKNIKRAMELPLHQQQIYVYLSSKYGVIPMFLAVLTGFVEYTFFGMF